MKIKAQINLELDTDDYGLAAATPQGANKLVAAMIEGQADWPERVEISVIGEFRTSKKE